MPVLIPIVAAVAAYAGSAMVVGAAVTAGMVAAGSFAAIAVGVVAGAVIGAAVGAVGAAVTGGDIGKGALWGAVGGAVAGGFAGAFAGSSGAATAANSVSASENATAGLAANQGTSTVVAETGMTAGEGTMYAAGITTAGQAVSGWAQGEAAGEANEANIAAAEKAQKEQFEQRMREIYANHESRMAEIGGQADNSLALADKNNAAAMEQLNTRIGHEKNTVATASEREDQKIAGFNESIRGTDENLFSRPTFDFNAESKQDVTFDSGFDEAVAKSPNLTPEELQAIEIQKQQQAVA